MVCRVQLIRYLSSTEKTNYLELQVSDRQNNAD
jgi:hypothetical protein